MSNIKVMCVVAHQDDFEFNAGGLFAKLRKIHGTEIDLKIISTTRGASGHHEMNQEDTFRRREQEALESAAIIGAEYECLTCLDGNHLPGQVFISQNVLGGLWNTIRDFEPDVIFCPPVVADPLAGIHIDHYNTAWAVRMVAYQLTVPHAYPTMNGIPKLRIKYPIIVNIDDSYAGGKNYDLAIDISDVFEEKLKMVLCHKSQIFEWLPWNCGESVSINKKDFPKRFMTRHLLINERYGKDHKLPYEYFKLTQWGKNIKIKDLEHLLFP